MKPPVSMTREPAGSANSRVRSQRVEQRDEGEGRSREADRLSFAGCRLECGPQRGDVDAVVLEEVSWRFPSPRKTDTLPIM